MGAAKLCAAWQSECTRMSRPLLVPKRFRSEVQDMRQTSTDLCASMALVIVPWYALP